MRTPDLLLAGLSSLRRQKLRTTLTTLGVTIGIATLVASVSVGLGVRQIIEDGFKKQHRLREILVYPGFDRASDEFTGVPDAALTVEGEMSDERRERIKRRLAREWRSKAAPPSPKPLTKERLAEFSGWDHVIAVRPGMTEQARFTFRGTTIAGECTGYTGDPDRFAGVVEFGRPPTEGTREVVVHEYLLYRWGVRSDDEVRAVLGQPLRVNFQGSEGMRTETLLSVIDVDASKLAETELAALNRAKEMLPKAVEKMDLPDDEKAALLRALTRKNPAAPPRKKYAGVATDVMIVGVVRSPNAGIDAAFENLGGDGFGDVMFAGGTAEELFARLPYRGEYGFSRAVLTVDADDNLKPVCDRLKAEGHHYFAIGLYLQTARKNALLIGFTMDFVALVALGVACLGIMNTMLTAVLERVKEIGIMKAVGAKDRHILMMFLFEGALIGLIGGWLGVLIGWAASFPGDNVALKLIAEQEPNMPKPETVFRYPLWLILGAPAFAVILTTLAGLLPARRAARVEPVVALRSE
ncbi:MAG TPA: ABC transporter permease [Gemmataceae bacterium]|nr:ABC transporter permease [Gemmataceae bacterium]